MNKTDFGQLAALVEVHHARSLRGARGVGRTRYACHQVANAVQRSRPCMNLVWLVPNHSWVDHIQSMLYEVLRERNISMPMKQPDGTMRWTRGFGDFTRLQFLTPSRRSIDRLRGIEFDLIDDLEEAEDYFNGEEEWSIVLQIREMESRMRGKQRMRRVVEKESPVRCTQESSDTCGPFAAGTKGKGKSSLNGNPMWR